MRDITSPMDRIRRNLEGDVPASYEPDAAAGRWRDLALTRGVEMLPGMSRITSTAAKFTEPGASVGEKLMNFMSGLKTYRVSPEQTKALSNELLDQAIRDTAGNAAKEFTRVSVPIAMRPLLPPGARQENEALEMLRATWNRRYREQHQGR